jgi:hypothetical protein
MSFVRGSTLFFSAPCLDASGAPVTPDSANLYLVYVSTAGSPVKETLPMSIAGNVVSAEWESAGASAIFKLYWSIRAVGSDTIVKDGEISLTANPANPIT